MQINFSWHLKESSCVSTYSFTVVFYGLHKGVLCLPGILAEGWAGTATKAQKIKGEDRPLPGQCLQIHCPQAYTSPHPVDHYNGGSLLLWVAADGPQSVLPDCHILPLLYTGYCYKNKTKNKKTEMTKCITNTQNLHVIIWKAALFTMFNKLMVKYIGVVSNSCDISKTKYHKKVFQYLYFIKKKKS